jgi:hypothetical protein
MDRSYQSGTSAQTEPRRQEAEHLAERAKQEGQSFLEERKRATADEIGAVAEVLRAGIREMHHQEQPPLIVSYAEQAASRLDQYSRTLRERNVNTLVRQAEDFAHRQPGVFVGGAVVAGFLLARFFRSSALHSAYDYPHSSQASGGTNTDYPSATGAGSSTVGGAEEGRVSSTTAPGRVTTTPTSAETGSSAATVETAARPSRSTNTPRKGEK